MWAIPEVPVSSRAQRTFRRTAFTKLASIAPAEALRCPHSPGGVLPSGFRLLKSPFVPHLGTITNGFLQSDFPPREPNHAIKQSSSPEYRLWVRSFRTAIPKAFFCPTKTTSFFPRVTAV